MNIPLQLRQPKPQLQLQQQQQQQQQPQLQPQQQPRHVVGPRLHVPAATPKTQMVQNATYEGDWLFFFINNSMCYEEPMMMVMIPADM